MVLKIMNESRMADEIENSSLKLRLQKLEALVNQQLILKKDVTNEIPLGLQMKMAKNLKIINRLRSKAAGYRQEIADKNILLKKMENHIKSTWNLLLVIGNKLEKVGKLDVNEKNQLQNEFKKFLDLGVSQNKGESDVFGILKGLPVSSFKIRNSSESCAEENSEYYQVIGQEKNVTSSNYSLSSLLSPRNVSTNSNESCGGNDLTSLNKEVEKLKDASYYHSSPDALSDKNSCLYIKDSPSFQQISFKSTLCKAKDFSSQHLNNPLSSDNASLYKQKKVNDINDKMLESLQQKNFTPWVINPTTETHECYPEKESSSISEAQQKLLSNNLLNVKNSSPEQLTDSDNMTICKLDEVDNDKVIHNKDDELLKPSFSAVDDLDMFDEDNHTELSNNISDIPQDSILPSDHAQNESIKSPINNSYSLKPINHKNSSGNVEEYNLESCSATDSRRSLNFEEEDDQKVCASKTSRQKVSKSLSLTSLKQKSSVNANIDSAAFTTDVNENSSENSVNLNSNKSCSEEDKKQTPAPIPPKYYRKKPFSEISKFHINHSSSKRLKSAFNARVFKSASQISQWDIKFKKINEQLKNDKCLKVNNVDSNIPCKTKGNQKQYTVAGAEKLSINGESITIENPEFIVDSNCETEIEACVSNSTLTQSKVKNSTKYNPKVKHLLDKDKIISNSDKRVMVGSYISYTESKNVDMNNSNHSDQNKSNLTLSKNKKKRYCAIEEFFQNFKKRQLSHENFTSTVQMLVSKFKCPGFFSSVSEMLFHTLTYLFKSKENPLLTYSINEDSAVQIPLDENCIVTALFTVESMHLPHLQDILRHAMTTLHHLILSKKEFNMFSLGSFCRVLVEICKREGNFLKPVILCADLLKMRHPFATYLIASIAVVWKELFKIEENLPAEEILFHSSILYGAYKNLRRFSDGTRDISLKVIASYFTAPHVKCSKSAIPVLKYLIEMRCQDVSWNSQYLTSALVILAQHEDWDWIECNLLTNFIIPNLNKFGSETLNEHAFEVFCNLYLDVFLLQPGDPIDNTLIKFFNHSISIEGENFVKDCAALSLIRFMYLTNRQLPAFLGSWFQENKQKPKVQQIEFLFKRRKMTEDLKSLRLEDIL